MCKMNHYQRIISWVLVAFLSVDCSNTAKNSDNKIQLDEPDADYFESVSNEINYKIPSPIELFLYMEQSGSQFTKEQLNPISHLPQYATTYQKAINFGIYSADMAYCSVYGDYQETFQYFETAKKLATELDLYNSYSEDLVDKVSKNLVEVDSLIEIAAQSYSDMSTYLEDQGLSDIHCLIITGGWIESLYICFSSGQKCKSPELLMERIADQQLLLENLIELLKNNQHSNNVRIVLNKLEELQEEYDVLYANGDKTIITPQQFANIANKVTEIRNEIVS